RDPVRLPEPVQLAQPAEDGRPDRRATADALLRPRPGRNARARPAGARARFDQHVRHRQVPARAERRRAPASRDRAGARGRADAARLRRDHIGARRLGAGGDRRPDRGAAARHAARPPVRHAQPGVDPDDRRGGGRDEQRPDRRARQGRRRPRLAAGAVYEEPAERYAQPRGCARRRSGVTGRVAPGFEPVAAAFEETLAGSGGGAAFAAVVDGEELVDLWGGYADDERRRPWAEDTVQLVFSATKGLSAVCLLLLLELCALLLDAPFARYLQAPDDSGKDV